MKSLSQFRFLCAAIAAAVFALPALVYPERISARGQQATPDEVRGAPAEPTDAAETRAQIDAIEKLLPNFPDRAAALYVIAAAQQHLGESREAIKLLKECIALREGFDPSGGPDFAGLRTAHEFTDLIEKVHRDFPVVAQARLALLTEEKNLIPEGLAWDQNRKVFYLSSLAQRKIIEITPDSHASDFVPANRDHLLPVLGIRLDPRDSTIWANTAEDRGNAALVHFSPDGAVLGRYALNDSRKHLFNDLVVRKSGEVILTDSVDNEIVRFDPATQKFSQLKVHRDLFYPNGIALAPDDNTLFVADSLGVLRIDLQKLASVDVNPGPHNTIAGADGLYWYNRSLIAIQNGIGSPRVAAFKLSEDGTRVTRTTVLENRSQFTTLPTTGAIRGSDFYFISNSHIDNLNDDKILDVTQLEPVRIAVIHLP